MSGVTLSETPALTVANLSVQFGGLKALSNVALELRQGEILGVIGPNGAGKTTLFNVICGLVQPNSGSLSLFGNSHPWPAPHDLVDLGISRTVQGVGLFPDLTVLENVMIGAHRFARQGMMSAIFGKYAKDENQLRERSMYALERVYAAGLANRRVDSLPYPITKRIAIARALVSEPRILMLDEPAGGLGHEDIEWLNRLVSELTAQCSVLIVEHHMEVVMKICDRLTVLNFGEVIASGDVATVREDPEVIAAYLGAGAK